MVRSTQTTSPLLPLLASVDAARRDLAVDGRARVERAVDLADRARRPARPPCRACACTGPAAGDPLKVSVDVTGLGLTGFLAEELLRRSCALAPEGADLTRVHLVVGLGDDERDRRGAAGRVRPPRPPGRPARPGAPCGGCGAGRARSPSRPPPGPGAAHPAPGVPRPVAGGPAGRGGGGGVRRAGHAVPARACPVLAPGEVLTAAGAAYLADVVAAGAHVHGTADPSLRTVRVVAEPRTLRPPSAPACTGAASACRPRPGAP